MARTLTTVALALLLWLALTSFAHAQCTQYYDSTVPVPAGFGAAYDVFDQAHPLLETVDCATPPTIHLTIGPANSATQLIWQTAYLSKDGTTWSPVPLSAATLVRADGYFQSQAFGTLPLASADLSSEWNFIAFLVAYERSGALVYGCRDAACATPGWNLQAITTAALLPHLTISFVPASPSILDNTSIGTLVAHVQVNWSDGSLFTGALSFGAPYNNDGGICALTGATVTIGSALPSGTSTQNCTIVATQ